MWSVVLLVSLFVCVCVHIRITLLFAQPHSKRLVSCLSRLRLLIAPLGQAYRVLLHPYGDLPWTFPSNGRVWQFYCTTLYCTLVDFGSTLPYATLHYSTLLYAATLLLILLYSTLLYFTLLYCTVLYCTVLYCTLLYSILLYSTLPYPTLLYSTLLYFTLLRVTIYSMLLYSALLYATLPYPTLVYSTHWLWFYSTLSGSTVLG